MRSLSYHVETVGDRKTDRQASCPRSTVFGHAPVSMRLSFISTLLTIVNLLPLAGCLSKSSNLSWNGHVDAGTLSPAPFRPYYVPAGAKGYPSSSPLIFYKGKWSYSYSHEYAYSPLHSTAERGAVVTFGFVGTGIEWFGSCGKHYGSALVLIDGKPSQTVNMSSNNVRPLRQQRLFWDYNLLYGKHTITITNLAGFSAMDVDAFVVTHGQNPVTLLPSVVTTVAPSKHTNATRVMLSETQLAQTSLWNLVQEGSTGVSAMQLAVISTTHVIIIDKVQHNPLTINGRPAWSALYNLVTHEVSPLTMQSNSFCAGGTFLRNGTLISVGGNPVVEDRTSAADFGDVNGLQAIRVFEPCNTTDVQNCQMAEYHDRIRMASPRWYATTIRLSDGSAMIMGGSKRGGWINNATTNNPTIEFYPPKNIHNSNGLPIHMAFLVDTLNANLFPIAFVLSDGKIFIAANRNAMIYDWITNTERRLPPIPNGVRVTYPMSGTGLLLPLCPENNYESEILICGGSSIDDQKESYKISSQEPASAQCVRMVLNEEGISKGWQVEQMPEARTMLDAVLLPDGTVLILNGAGSGISGYGNVVDRVGESNADNPVLSPVYYNPRAPPGQRFSTAGMPRSSIPRMYHSVATLVPDGRIFIAGSNPNLDRSELKYGTEYRVEWIHPPYWSRPRPVIENCPTMIGFGEVVHVTFSYSAASDNKMIKGMLVILTSKRWSQTT